MTAAALVPLLNLPDVREALDAARTAADTAMRHRALRRSGGAVAAEVGLRSAVASAALEGHPFDLDQVRNGTVTSPVVQGALRAAAALDGLTSTWRRAPRQVLARLHTLVAADLVPEPALGRPTGDPAVAARLDTLARLVAASLGSPAGTAVAAPRGAAAGMAAQGGAPVPALLLAAVVHGELLALGAFEGPGGVLARAAGRLTLIAGGLDPRGLLAVDVGHLRREPEYIGAANAFATGTPDGIRSWLKHCAAAVEVAAEELVTACETAADRG